jgi:hypothetical protein
MHPAEYRHLDALIQRGDEHRGKIEAEIDFAAGDPFRRVAPGRQPHVTDIGKALGAQQFFGHVLRGNAEAGKGQNARWWFRDRPPRPVPAVRQGAQRHPPAKASSEHGAESALSALETSL